MRRILTGLAMTALFLGLLPSLAVAQADHLQCFKIKDTVAKATYTADLTPADTGFPVATGCIVRVPARLLCVDVVKSIVGTQPPGAPAGAPVPVPTTTTTTTSSTTSTTQPGRCHPSGQSPGAPNATGLCQGGMCKTR